MSEYLTCKEIREDADLRLMCVHPKSQTEADQEKDIINYMESITKTIPAFLRSPEILQSQQARRVYQFDTKAQDQGLNNALNVTLLHQDEHRGVDYDYALLAAGSQQEIREIRRLFAVEFDKDVKK